MMLEDMQKASKMLIEALRTRERYMSISLQSFPTTTSRFLHLIDGIDMPSTFIHADKQTIAGNDNDNNIFSNCNKKSC